MVRQVSLKERDLCELNIWEQIKDVFKVFFNMVSGIEYLTTELDVHNL